MLDQRRPSAYSTYRYGPSLITLNDSCATLYALIYLSIKNEVYSRYCNAHRGYPKSTTQPGIFATLTAPSPSLPSFLISFLPYCLLSIEDQKKSTPCYSLQDPERRGAPPDCQGRIKEGGEVSSQTFAEVIKQRRGAPHPTMAKVENVDQARTRARAVYLGTQDGQPYMAPNRHQSSSVFCDTFRGPKA